MPRTRTFIAVDLGKEIRSRLVSLQDNLAQAGVPVKWVEPENLHVTLLFLGEVDDRQLPAICKLVAEGVKDRPAFTMSVETVGCFPDARRPRILWVGVAEGAAPLCAIHDDLETPLTDLGYRRENRRYTPHITLGRVKSDRPSDALAQAIGKKAKWKAGDVPVREILVMGSVLTAGGPQYTVLGRAKLR